MKQLNLKKVSVYALKASVDELSSKILGYYKDVNIASVDAKGAGWYGSDGNIETVTLYEDEQGNIYNVKYEGKYKDVDREYRTETIEKIKSKLTPKECKLLGI
jgi:hypothetical protein